MTHIPHGRYKTGTLLPMGILYLFGGSDVVKSVKSWIFGYRGGPRKGGSGTPHYRTKGSTGGYRHSGRSDNTPRIIGRCSPAGVTGHLDYGTILSGQI